MVDYANAKAEAKKLVAKYGYTAPPIDPEVIAEGEGVDVVFVDFAPPHDRDVSGFYDFNEGRIYINKAIPPARKNWTIAHELGHHILHQQYAASETYTYLPRNNGYPSGKPAEEKEADCFAAELLVPIDMLKVYNKRAGVSELAAIFAVSREAITHRLKSLRFA